MLHVTKEMALNSAKWKTRIHVANPQKIKIKSLLFLLFVFEDICRVHSLSMNSPHRGTKQLICTMSNMIEHGTWLNSNEKN